MALHLTSCEPHGIADTKFGEIKPGMARFIDALLHSVEQINAGAAPTPVVATDITIIDVQVVS